MTAALAVTPRPTLTLVPDDGVRSGRPESPEVYRRRRLAVVAVLIGLALGLASFVHPADATPTGADPAPTVLVVVEPGDTLWGIAAELAPDRDPRPLVSALSDLAGGSGLQPGQVLELPAGLVG